MVIAVFLILIFVLYGYLIRRIWLEGHRRWLWMVGLAIVIKLGAIAYLIFNAPIN